MGFFDRFKKKPEPGAVETAEEELQAEQPTEEAPAAVVAAASAEPAPPSEEPEKKGLFSRFRKGLHKTTQVLNTDIRDLFKQEGQLVDEAF